MMVVKEGMRKSSGGCSLHLCVCVCVFEDHLDVPHILSDLSEGGLERQNEKQNFCFLDLLFLRLEPNFPSRTGGGRGSSI